MPDRTHELCPDCSEPIFPNWLKKKLWKTRALDSATSPRFPKFQQASTGFLRTGFVVLSCEVKVKSKSLKPAAAVHSFLRSFSHHNPKHSAIRAREEKTMTSSDEELLRALLKEQSRGSPSVWRTRPSLLEDREMSPLASQVMKNEKDRQTRNLSQAHSGKKKWAR
jgi:hypothetical protein